MTIMELYTHELKFKRVVSFLVYYSITVSILSNWAPKVYEFSLNASFESTQKHGNASVALV